MSVDAILKVIEGLTPPEVTELKARIAERFPDPPAESNVSPELAQLLNERDAAYEANPTDVYTWEEVVAHVKRKK